MSTGEGTKITLVLGAKDSGKTVYVRGDEKLNVEGFFNMYLEVGIKILIIDTTDHRKYQDIPVITIEQLKTWKNGIYRIFLRDTEMDELYDVLYSNEYKNLDDTFIVFEDAFKHIRFRVHETLMNFFLDAKNRNIEILLMYHAWGWIPNDLYKIINFLQVFKTGDSPKKKLPEMPGYEDLAMAVYEEVKKHPSPWYNKLIVTGI